jgi:hypothetical protein
VYLVGEEGAGLVRRADRQYHDVLHACLLARLVVVGLVGLYRGFIWGVYYSLGFVYRISIVQRGRNAYFKMRIIL